MRLWRLLAPPRDLLWAMLTDDKRTPVPFVLPLTAIGRSHLGNPDSNQEKQIWVIREKKTKAGGNNRKRPSLIQRKNEKRKKKRRNKYLVTLLRMQ